MCDNFKLFRSIVRYGSPRMTLHHARFEPTDLPFLVLGLAKRDNLREHEPVPIGLAAILGRPDQAPLIIKQPAGWACSPNV